MPDSSLLFWLSGFFIGAGAMLGLLSYKGWLK